MVTKLDLFFVKSLLEKVAKGNDKVKADAALDILSDGLLMYEYTNVFVAKREKDRKEKECKQKVYA